LDENGATIVEVPEGMEIKAIAAIRLEIE